MSVPIIQFIQASKQYGDTYALQPLDLDIAAGEISQRCWFFRRRKKQLC